MSGEFQTFEPFHQNKWQPDFVNPKDIPSDAYGRLVNLNVLNVLNPEARAEAVKNMGRVMQPGGTGIVTTRGMDVMRTKSGHPGPEPTSFVTGKGTYQKGFTPTELEDYLKYMLGQGYNIDRLGLGPAGALIRKKADGGLSQYAEGGKTAAWQRKEGKNPEGGLNAKGRASYHAETGGTLKRPQPEGGARRDSFCARMKGMKKKLTSAETANDPDSRINKSLRAWNCAEGGLIGLAGGGKTTPLRYAASWLLKKQDPADMGNVYLKNPLHLADEARLSGFTSPEQNVFFGRTRTGQEFTIHREYVDPETSLRSRDKNKTAEFLKDMFQEYKKPE